MLPTLMASGGPVDSTTNTVVTLTLPKLISHGGPMIWLLFIASSVALAVVVDRLLHYHRAQINSMEFLAGIRNVLRRANVVEAISICDATPGPVPRLVKVAILNREKGRDVVREALEDAGLVEVPRLEDKLSLLATIAQLSPLLGLFGTVLGFIRIFTTLQQTAAPERLEQLRSSIGVSAQLSSGVWEALIATAVGLAVAIPSYAAYNYLVHRVNTIVLDMERAATEILNIVTEPPKNPGA